MKTPTPEEMEIYYKEQVEEKAELIKGYPEEFGLVFDRAVSMGASIASSTNCEVSNIQNCNAITKLRDYFKYKKNPRNPNANEASALPEFIKFTNSLGAICEGEAKAISYNVAFEQGEVTPAVLSVKQASGQVQYGLVACLCVLQHYHEDPDSLECLRKYAWPEKGFTFFTTAGAPGYVLCARYLMGMVFEENTREHLTSFIHSGCDLVTRENIIRAYAEKLWEREGKPDGRSAIHWGAATLIVDEILELRGNLEVFKIIGLECGQGQTGRWFQKNGYGYAKP